MSLERLVTFVSLTPCSSSISYRVTVGPWVMLTTEEKMPKLWRAFSSRSRVANTSSRESAPALLLRRSRLVLG